MSPQAPKSDYKHKALPYLKLTDTSCYTLTARSTMTEEQEEG